MIYVLSGQNRHLAREKLVEIIQEFSKKYGESAVERYQGEDIDPANLVAILNGQSLFASSKLIIFRDMLAANKSANEKFLEMMDSIPEETSVVLLEGELDKRTSAYKKLSKQQGFFEFKELGPAELASFVSSYVKRHNKSINNGAVQELLARSGSDQSRLKNELDKLISYVDTEITKDDITILVEQSVDDQVFELLDNALRGRAQPALNILRDMEAAHKDPHQVLGMLIWQVQTLAIVKSGEDRPESQIAKEAKIHPFVVQKTKALTSNMSGAQINKIINLAAELDIKSKSTSLPLWRQIERVITRLI